MKDKLDKEYSKLALRQVKRISQGFRKEAEKEEVEERRSGERKDGRMKNLTYFMILSGVLAVATLLVLFLEELNILEMIMIIGMSLLLISSLIILGKSLDDVGVEE